MRDTETVPAEAVEAAVHNWDVESDADCLEGAMRDALQAALPAIRSQILRGLRERLDADLHSDEDGRLAGPLGERIAGCSGSVSLEFTTPEEVRQGIVDWLDT